MLAVFHEAIRLALDYIQPVSSPVTDLFKTVPSLVASGTVGISGTIGTVGGLDDKLRAIARWHDETPEALQGNGGSPGWLILPSSQADAPADLPGLVLARASTRDDLFAHLVTLVADGLRRFTAANSEWLAREPRWHRLRRWQPNALHPDDAIPRFLVEPGSVHLFGLPGHSLPEVMEKAWARRRDELPDNAGSRFDELFVRWAAIACVGAKPELSATASPGRRASSAPSQQFPCLAAWQAGMSPEYDDDDWRALVAEVLAEPVAVLNAAGGDAAALARVALLAVNAGVARAPADVVDRLAATASQVVPQSPMPEPLCWDLASLARLAPASSLSCPVLHVWVRLAGEDNAIDEIIIVGAGDSHVHREVTALTTAVQLQAETGSRDFRVAGLTVLSASGAYPLLTRGTADIVARRGVAGRVMSTAAPARTAQLVELFGELKALAARTGLIQIHEIPPNTSQQLDAAWAEFLVSGDSPIQPLRHAAPAVGVWPLAQGVADVALPLPPFVLRTAAFASLRREFAGFVFDEMVPSLDRRIAFYTATEDSDADRRC
jgi:hypothetical protein